LAGYRCCSVAVPAMIAHQRGFALLIVLWTVGFLALLGTQIVAAGRSDTQLADNLKQEAILAAAADGAVQNVVFRMLAARDPGFQADGLLREVQIGQTPVLVLVANETDRVNLNTAASALLRALFQEVGAAPAQANRLAAAVLDWRTSGAIARPNGAKGRDYAAAGVSYGPPGTPFQTVDELKDVLGMTPALFARVAPHVTVFTDGDPDFSTRDPVVNRALTDAAGVADDIAGAQSPMEQMLRIRVTAIGRGQARYSLVVVAASDFQAASPRVTILSRVRDFSVPNGVDTMSMPRPDT
jgi:general secretion pathway protein K